MSANQPASPRFLIVDPIPAVQNFASQLLESYGFAGDTIRCCADTQTALTQGLELKPDFLVTDWFAKATLSGIALHQRLREVSPQCRLALLSYEVTPEHEAQARTAGSRFLLRKPFTATELSTTLKNALVQLNKERPDLAQRFHAPSSTPGGKDRDIKPINMPMPVLQTFKPGDKVVHREKPETIQYVVISHGELAVQFQGRAGLVPAREVRLK